MTYYAEKIRIIVVRKTDRLDNGDRAYHSELGSESHDEFSETRDAETSSA